MQRSVNVAEHCAYTNGDMPRKLRSSDASPPTTTLTLPPLPATQAMPPVVAQGSRTLALEWRVGSDATALRQYAVQAGAAGAPRPAHIYEQPGRIRGAGATEVVLSYAPADEAAVRELRARLDGDGFTTFMRSDAPDMADAALHAAPQSAPPPQVHARAVLVRGAELASSPSSRRVSFLTGMRIHGRAFTLEDGVSQISLSDAVMWAKVHPFSPTHSGCRLNPF